MDASSVGPEATASKRLPSQFQCLEIGGRAVLFDAEDWPKLAGFDWRLYEAKPGKLYVRACIGQGRQVSMHRLLMADKLAAGEIVDHRDGNGLNNRRSNLRAATRAQNSLNRPADAGRTWKGVHRYGGSKSWVARIGKAGVIYYLGSFDSPRKAAAAYNRVARRLHGEFARLNELGRP